MPDIDIDFQDDRRDEVVEYVAQKYGHHMWLKLLHFQPMDQGGY